MAALGDGWRETKNSKGDRKPEDWLGIYFLVPGDGHGSREFRLRPLGVSRGNQKPMADG